jgi:hypothetical protein
MGAALTYARRYGLFTLVGIAGEDDLDAPDLASRVEATSESDTSKPPRMAVPDIAPTPARPLQNKQFKPTAKSAAMLSPDGSARERDRLIAELSAISNWDDAVAWARKILPVKNALTREHASEVEAAFERAMQSIGDLAKELPADLVTAPSKGPDISDGENLPVSEFADGMAAVDPALQRIPRRRDKAHLRFVAAQPCLVCGRAPSDPHHLRFAQRRGLGLKVSDEFTVPLCRTHHRQLHQAGNEMQWWRTIDSKIDPLKVANALWKQSRNGAQIPIEPTKEAAEAKT